MGGPWGGTLPPNQLPDPYKSGRVPEEQWEPSSDTEQEAERKRPASVILHRFRNKLRLSAILPKPTSWDENTA